MIYKHYLLFLVLTLLSSCGGDLDPGGRIFWTFIGLPLLGVSYVLGGVVMSWFQSKEENSRANQSPIAPTIIGAIILFVLYSIYQGVTD